jgi:hypothetical protein
LNSDWILYRSGQRNLKGWMIDRSNLLRYFLRFHQWMCHPVLSSNVRVRENRSTPNGYSLRDEGKTLVRDPEREKRFVRMLKQFRISDQRLADFENFLCLCPEVKVFVVEMPTHYLFKTFFPEGENDYQKHMRLIRDLINKHNSPFIPAPQGKFDSDDLYYQTNHMNGNGAKKFSLWLGQKIGAIIKTDFPPEVMQKK